MSTEIAEKTAEVVAENVEDAVDGVVEIVEVFRNNPVVLAVAGGLGLVAGGVGGYFIARKLLERIYEEQLSEQIDIAKQFYSGLYKVDSDGRELTPQEVLEQRQGREAIDAVRLYQGRSAIEEEIQAGQMLLTEGDEQDEAQIKKIENAHFHSVSLDAEPGPGGGKIEKVVETTTGVNVFSDDTFDLEEESKYRTAERPYIITFGEYYDNETEYDQSELTYYELDDTLTDEMDKPVDGVDNIVGDENLVRFGSGSKDKNKLFIRNDKLGMDFEITKSRGSYLEEVLGMPNEDTRELKHSADRDRRRAFRRGDE